MVTTSRSGTKGRMEYLWKVGVLHICCQACLRRKQLVNVSEDNVDKVIKELDREHKCSATVK